MAKKEFRYRGKTADELQAMTGKELADVFPAAARRKLKRGFTPAEKILLRNLKTSSKPVKTHCRTMLILPEMIGKEILVHTGKAFEPVHITIEMLGHRIGEYVLSRRRVTHSSPGIGATRSSSNVSVK